MSTGRPLTMRAGSNPVYSVETVWQLYRSVKPAYDEVAKSIKRLKQARALLDSESRAKTLVDLSVEAAYRVAAALTDVGSTLPVVKIFKAYHQVHFKVLAAAVQAMANHERALGELKRLGEISNKVVADSPAHIRNYSVALADQRLAARNEVAIIRMFRPAGYHATGIADRIVAGLVRQAGRDQLAAAFPNANPNATRAMAEKIIRDSKYQGQAVDSMRDNIDLAWQQMVEVTAAATTYRHLILSAASINALIARRSERAANGELKVVSALSAKIIEEERLQAQEVDYSMPRLSELIRIDEQWESLVSSWATFCDRLQAFNG